MNKQDEVVKFVDAVKLLAGKAAYTRLTTNPNYFFVQYGNDCQYCFNLIWFDKRQNWQFFLDAKAYAVGKAKVITFKSLDDVLVMLKEVKQLEINRRA